MEQNSMKKQNEAYERYLKATHTLGRILTATVLVFLLAAPFVIGLYLGAMPNISAALKAFLGVGLVYLISCVVEYLIYVCVLGRGNTLRELGSPLHSLLVSNQP